MIWNVHSNHIQWSFHRQLAMYHCFRDCLSLSISLSAFSVSKCGLHAETFGPWMPHWTQYLMYTMKSVGRLVSPLPLVWRVTRVDQRWTACYRLDRAGSSDGLAVCWLDRCLVGRSRSYWQWWLLWNRSWVMRRVHCPWCSRQPLYIHCQLTGRGSVLRAD
jgi:hypothetical protein